MPIPGARFRVKTMKGGDKVRLAFKDGEVVEAKNLKTGAMHTQAEFARDKKRRGKKSKRRPMARVQAEALE